MGIAHEELRDTGLRVVLDANRNIDKLINEQGHAVFDSSVFVYNKAVNSAAPLISPATAVTDDVLTCSTGTWTVGGTNPVSAYAYQWQRDGVDINGATAATHTCVVADEDLPLTCKVTATNRGGTTSAVTSSNTVTPTAPPP